MLSFLKSVIRRPDSDLMSSNQSMSHDESFSVQLSEAQFGDHRLVVLPQAGEMYRAVTVTTSPDLDYQLHEPQSPIEHSSVYSNSQSVDISQPQPARSTFVRRLTEVSPLWNYVLTQPTSCIQSLLVFNNYAMISYTCLILHFVMLYLSGFFLFMSFAYENPPIEPGEPAGHRTTLGVGYEVMLAFYGVRSFVMFSMYSIRLCVPRLWRSDSGKAAKVFHHILHAFSICTAFSSLVGVLLYAVIAPPSQCPSAILHSGVFLFFLIRDFVSLVLPLIALGVLHRRHHITRLSMHLPYVPIRSQRVSHPKRSPSMSPEHIKALPCRTFDSQTDEQTTCAICLSDLVDGDSMRELGCNHGFHTECMDAWLVKRASCPLCVRVVSVTHRETAIEIPTLTL